MVRIGTRHDGSVRQYATGCRCVACRLAWRDYMRARRGGLKPRRQRTPPPAKRDFSYYRGKTGFPVSVTLTPLGRQLLEAAKARTARSGSDIVEHLLRLYGGAVTFDEAQHTAA